MIRVFGQITDASGKGVAGAMIELRALKSSTEVLYGSVLTYKCDASGRYEFPLATGAYDAYAQNDICGDMDYLGTAVVTADTDDGDLHHILVDGGINITPPILDTAMEFALRAEKAATSAKSDRIQTGKDVIVTGQNKQVAETKAQESATSADEAKAARDSIVQDANEVRLNTQQVTDNAASVASNTALVQRNAEQVAQNTQTVSTKALQVSENTQSVAANTQAVSLMRDEVAAKTSMAQGAADTATQKAASAAEHDAAAAEYARQAQEAAQATAGALIDGGAADLSTGVYPQPVQVSGAARPTFWKVTKGGTVGGVDYGVGDTLIYTVAGSGSYYKIDNTESVTSVQGEKGAVTLTPEKIGAEPAGSTAAAITQHSEKAGAHTINGVSGLAAALDAKIDSSAQLVPDGQDLIVFLRNTKTKLLRVGGAVSNAPRGWIGGDMFVIDHSANYRCVFAIGLDGICHSLAIYPDKIVGWVKQYGSNSIVGDVSQIGGVPTGAIMQTGSNSNGRYIKYADGTLVNFCMLTIPATAVNKNFSANKQWPHQFIDKPYHVSFTMIGTDSGNVYAMGQLNKNGYKDNSSATYAVVDGYTYTDPLSTVVIMSAAGYGRWY